jgi:LmbE family N-acetylglucosaminyl deacetylase
MLWEAVSVLCLVAHSDDIEFGGGGTILSWIETGVKLHVLWCVLSAPALRAAAAKASAAGFLKGAISAESEICDFRDGFIHTNEVTSRSGWKAQGTVSGGV